MFAVIVTAIDETWSLKQTIDTLTRENPSDISDIIIVTAAHATPQCRAAIDECVAEHQGLVRWHEQCRLRGVGGANIECAEMVQTEWVIIMASDLETPPETVKTLIARAKQGDVDVVATSRWLEGGNFGDYNRVKLLCNWIFQRVYSLLYFCSLTDMTYGFRAYRTRLFARYRWEETGHAFFMESICKFLRDGIRIVELPAQWRKRQEGESRFPMSEFLRYFRVGFTTRFARKKSFLVSSQPHPRHGADAS